MEIPLYTTLVFSLAAIRTLSLLLFWFCYILIWVRVHLFWDPLWFLYPDICFLLDLGEFLSHNFLKYIFDSFSSLLWDPYNVNVSMLNVIPESSCFHLKKKFFFPKIFWLGDFHCSISRSLMRSVSICCSFLLVCLSQLLNSSLLIEYLFSSTLLKCLLCASILFSNSVTITQILLMLCVL